MLSWQKYLGLAVILLLSYGAVFSAGWASRGERVVVKEVKVVQQAKKASEMVLERRSDLRVQNERLKVKLEEALEHASDNAQCVFTRNDVSLLNYGRLGVPDAAALADEEKHAPATLTQREEITAHADCGVRYRDLAADHDALIDVLVLSGRK
jgi:hypothetical protein